MMKRVPSISTKHPYTSPYSKHPTKEKYNEYEPQIQKIKHFLHSASQYHASTSNGETYSLQDDELDKLLYHTRVVSCDSSSAESQSGYQLLLPPLLFYWYHNLYPQVSIGRQNP